MNNDSKTSPRDIGVRALVAAFADRDDAREAVKTLHKEGFHKTWIGLTRGGAAGDTTVKGESLGSKLGRFFSGDKDGTSLVDTLTRHGVSENEAMRVERQLEPDDVLLTVDGNNHPEYAAQIIEDAGGDILSGESFAFTSVEWSASDDRPGSELLGYENPTEYARGKRVDDDGITRLRNERLLGTTVPTLREDIFIARYDEDFEPER